MGTFVIRYGNRGDKISKVKSQDIVGARRKFKKLHPRVKIDSTQTLTSFKQERKAIRKFSRGL